MNYNIPQYKKVRGQRGRMRSFLAVSERLSSFNYVNGFCLCPVSVNVSAKAAHTYLYSSVLLRSSRSLAGCSDGALRGKTGGTAWGHAGERLP